MSGICALSQNLSYLGEYFVVFVTIQLKPPFVTMLPSPMLFVWALVLLPSLVAALTGEIISCNK